MTHFLYLIGVLLSGHAHIVSYDQPTGDLQHGDVVVEVGVPTIDVCNHRGGIPMTIDGTIWCVGEDF
jgi:hypothetical protein